MISQQTINRILPRVQNDNEEINSSDEPGRYELAFVD